MTDKVYKAEIVFDDRKIKVEGPKEFVEEMIAKYSHTSKLQGKNDMTTYSSETVIAPTVDNERELVAKKRPHGHHEIVAVLAFAITKLGQGCLRATFAVNPTTPEGPLAVMGFRGALFG